jgi:Ni/Co efflux regulator RcnB
MRMVVKPALLAVALTAAMPAAAQGYGRAPIPAPGGVALPAPLPPRVSPGQPGPGVPTAGGRVWQNGRWMALPPQGRPTGVRHDRGRWGETLGGRWAGGTRAPGGWGAYRRLGRGNRLPGYWMADGFRVPDFLSYGLAAPPQGYFWVRYYDDAVLVDGGGNVWDSVDGIGWVDGDAAYGYGDGYAGGSSASSYSYSNVAVGAPYRAPIAQVDPNAYYDGYPGGYALPAGAIAAPPAVQVQGGYAAGGSYQAGAYYYGAPVGSTVVITMPATTTTTTVVEEVVEDVTTTTTRYVRAAPRRVVRKAPVRRYRPRAQCCVCGCR